MLEELQLGSYIYTCTLLHVQMMYISKLICMIFNIRKEIYLLTIHSLQNRKMYMEHYSTTAKLILRGRGKEHICVTKSNSITDKNIST